MIDFLLASIWRLLTPSPNAHKDFDFNDDAALEIDSETQGAFSDLRLTSEESMKLFQSP